MERPRCAEVNWPCDVGLAAHGSPAQDELNSTRIASGAVQQFARGAIPEGRVLLSEQKACAWRYCSLGFAFNVVPREENCMAKARPVLWCSPRMPACAWRLSWEGPPVRWRSLSPKKCTWHPRLIRRATQLLELAPTPEHGQQGTS